MLGRGFDAAASTMKFWKKVLKKFKKQQDQDPKGLVEDKYFNKLQKKLDKLDHKKKKKK